MTASFSFLGLITLSLVTLMVESSLVNAKETPTTENSNNNRKLVRFPLLPGDSAEAKRRRRTRRTQRQLRHHNLRRVEEEASSKEEEPEENPLELNIDALYEGYGVHYVDLWVGQPTPQRVTTIVDTGSSVTGFPCTGCQHCGGRSSWDAYEAIDQVYTGGNHALADEIRVKEVSFPLHFGCQDSVTGLFETQLADGIMGLYNSKPSFWYQMYQEKKIENKAFSLCFSDPGHVDRQGTPAGAMVLGGSDTRLHQTPMVYAQQLAKEGKFTLHLEKVFLLAPGTGESTEIQSDQWNKVQIFEEDLNNGGNIILDSGTTATYLTKQLLRHFVEVFNSIVPESVMVFDPDQHRYELTQNQIDQFLPTIVLQIKGWRPQQGDNDNQQQADIIPGTSTQLPGTVGTDLDPKRAGKSILVPMPPSSYLSRRDDDIDPQKEPEEVCQYKFSFFFNKRRGKGGVLGANFMRGLDVLFDIDNSRIGFAASDCEFSTLASDEESG
ncbi:aspartic [Seminavis robusta]|uniref:Aspartic n=1 Tax=Seminavis robusta TaxID=568900 RepID=A0A9N8H8B4_9STRA|nr:aspartic [Seminavis robusta]|eukprot:Sro87_g045980.1 aspartic (495) ;mRNA; r:23769-25485